jgi:hypothetical protein
MPAIKSTLLNIIAFLQIGGGVFLLGLFLFVEIPKQLKTPPEGPALINWGITGLFISLAGSKFRIFTSAPLYTYFMPVYFHSSLISCQPPKR